MTRLHWACVIACAACGGGSSRIPAPPPLTGPVPPAPTPASIALGETFGCARTSDQVKCWGYQVPGLPSEPAHRETAERVPELDDAVAISGGRDRVCAVMRDATVRCAVLRSVPTGKYDVHGVQFHEQRPAVVRVPLRDVAQVAAGAGFACALVRDGTVHCWGINTAGELGDGTRNASDTPVAVAGLRDVVEIAAGMSSACARMTDGSVRCWGGRGDKDSLGIVAIEGVDHATQIACGGSHACARLADGTVRCWGGNLSGQLGRGTRDEDNHHEARPVVGLTGAAAVALGDNHSCARLDDGRVACWGDNTYGELGPRTPEDTTRDEQVSSTTFHWIERHAPGFAGVTGAVDLALGSYFTCIRTRDGGVQCFGRNDLGQAGPVRLD